MAIGENGQGGSADGGAAAGTGAGTGTGTAAAGTAATSGASGTTTATPGSGDTRTGATAPTGFTYQEDRSTWVPRHRLNEESTKRTALEAQIAERDRKIAALAGVTPQDPNAAKSDQLRQAIVDLFPQLGHLKDLTDEQMKRLLSSPDTASRAVEVEQREATRHGKAQLSVLYEQVADQIGADELTAEQKADLRDGFKSWFRQKCEQELQASGGTVSATLERYNDGDQALLQEYVKRHSSNWVEPARRRQTAQALTRVRPVPNSQGRAQVTSVKRPEKFASMDERLDYATNLLKERGVQFGG